MPFYYSPIRFTPSEAADIKHSYKTGKIWDMSVMQVHMIVDAQEKAVEYNDYLRPDQVRLAPSKDIFQCRFLPFDQPYDMTFPDEVEH